MTTTTTKIAAATIIPLAATTLFTTTHHTAHADTINAGDKYVAIGDSYASTGTLNQPTFGSHPACVQDQDNYPHQLARQLNLTLDDASCAWAFTYQYDQPQNHALPYTAPTPQKDHITNDTKLITISMGGNDAGLADIAVQCDPRIHIPGLPDCADKAQQIAHNKITNPDSAGRTLQQRLIDIANDAKRRAPQAKIIFTGYYTAAVRDHRCIDDGFLSDRDRAFLESYAQQINTVIETAAQQTSSTYIAPPDQPEGWCSQPFERNSNYFGIPEGNLIAHPTHAGQQHMAQAIANHLSTLR